MSLEEADRAAAPDAPPDRKRARFISLAEQAAIAMEEAAKKIKLAEICADQIYKEHPTYPGAEDTADFMQEFVGQAAKTWVMALQGKTIFQNSGEIIGIHVRHDNETLDNKQRVVTTMDISPNAFH